MCARRITFLCSVLTLMVCVFVGAAFANRDLISCIEQNKNKYPNCGPWCVEPCEVDNCDVFLYEQDLCSCIYYPMTCEMITNAAELHQKVWGSLDGKELDPYIYGSFKETSSKVQDDYEYLLRENIDKSKRSDIAATKELVKWEAYIRSLRAIEVTAENLKKLYELSYTVSQDYLSADKKELEKLASEQKSKITLLESRDRDYYARQFEGLPMSRKLKYRDPYDYIFECFDRDDVIIETLKGYQETYEVRIGSYDDDKTYQEETITNLQKAEEQYLRASLRRAQTELEYAKLAEGILNFDKKFIQDEIAKIQDDIKRLVRAEEESPDTTTENTDKDIETPEKDNENMNKDIETPEKDNEDMNKDIETPEKDNEDMNKDIETPEKDNEDMNKNIETPEKKDDVLQPLPEIKDPISEPAQEEDSDDNDEQREEEPEDEMITIQEVLYSSDKTPVSVSISYSGNDGFLTFNNQTISVTKDKNRAADTLGFIIKGTTWFPVNSSGISAIKTLLQYNFKR